MIAQANAPPDLTLQQRQALLVFPEARAVQRDCPRLLVVLPFVAYFVAEAVRAGARLLVRLTHRTYAGAALGAVALAGALAWNLAIAWDFIQDGRRDGDDIGSTGRYVQEYRDRPAQAFYLAADDRFPYYEWGTPQIWSERLRLFAGDHRRTCACSEAVDSPARPPATTPPGGRLFAQPQTLSLQPRRSSPRRWCDESEGC